MQKKRVVNELNVDNVAASFHMHIGFCCLSFYVPFVCQQKSLLCYPVWHSLCFCADPFFWKFRNWRECRLFLCGKGKEWSNSEDIP